jgi:hypothetical protein
MVEQDYTWNGTIPSLFYYPSHYPKQTNEIATLHSGFGSSAGYFQQGTPAQKRQAHT